MFSKSRQKIVLFTTAALVLFLAATLGSIFLSDWISVNRQNSEMLERYIGMYSLESPPGGTGGMPAPPSDSGASGMPVPPDSGAAENAAAEYGDGMTGEQETDPPAAIYQLSSFYSAAFSQDGEVLAVDCGTNGLYTREEIIKTAQEFLALNRSSGHRFHLLYRVEQKDGYTLVAFMDMTLSDNSMWNLLIHTMIMGAVAVCVLAVISARLARRIIEPLEENDRRQRQFISDAGHELKTPVAVISANAEILERQIGPSDWLENIKYENRRMGELVTGLLDLSHAENASIPMEPVDLSRLTEREVLPFESIAFEQGLMIDSEIGQDIRVKGNPSQLRQLVSILMDNAIRHGKGGEKVKIVLAEDKKNAVLSVSNRGEIPGEQLERLFDRFYRADKARTDPGDGRHYGLGLAIAKAIAESHGGKISAASKEGEVRFTVEIPLEK